eukprot:CAMPEP_0178905524 /NCGR_PEP_ID=MMETSP0786-20121207/6323_1 /TAXON_ID=186022 /ORGANISM="Thalassionema frauenfeldii, Strain CCMP 1798" /LENGTH=691 /DNA_ID=CAMNT_0020577141 /DNA_START=154 /DNA_END=2232 /DNA_ORIENTATION=+
MTHHPKLKTPLRDMVQTLVDIYGTVGDESSLPVIVESLATLMESSHENDNSTVRALCQTQLSQLTQNLTERLLELLQSKAPAKEPKKKKKKRKTRRSSTSVDDDDEEEDDDNKENDKEFAIHRCIQRLSILAKRIRIQEFWPHDFRQELVDAMTKRLEERQLGAKTEDDTDDPMENIIPLIWQKEISTDVHEACSHATKHTLDFLLACLAWDLYTAKQEENLSVDEDEDEDEDDDNKEEEEEDENDDTKVEEYADHVIVQQRDALVEFLGTCFQQFLPEEEDEEDSMYTDDHIQFSDTVQLAALQTCGDLRSLLPKSWNQARSPFLRAVALTEDQVLIGGSIRYFRSKTNDLRDQEELDVEDVSTVHRWLLPFGRSLVANWSESNRREAGYVFAHSVGSGRAAQDLLLALGQCCKRMDPVRLMETHMATLRTSFDAWLAHEPEDVESERPTDDEMAAFAAAEEDHRDEFELLLQQSKCLAQMLKPNKKALEAKLQDPMLAFLKEGIRFAFSVADEGEEDELLPGARLTFLLVLEHFGKLCKPQNAIVLRDYWTEQVSMLQRDPDYDQAHQDDLDAMEQFAKLMNFPVTAAAASSSSSSVGQSPKSVLVQDYDDEEEEEDSVAQTPRRSSVSRSSVARSSVSTALSPLLEEGEEEEESKSSGGGGGGARRSSVSMDTLEEEEEDNAVVEDES